MGTLARNRTFKDFFWKKLVNHIFLSLSLQKISILEIKKIHSINQMKVILSQCLQSLKYRVVKKDCNITLFILQLFIGMLVRLFGLFLFQYHQFCSGWLSTLYIFSKKNFSLCFAIIKSQKCIIFQC